jgi:uncharacterized alpha-E superfamily protein
MLSRLAETFFWMGRYLERTEGTTRLLNEFHHLIVQDRGAHAAHGCSLLTKSLGLESQAITAAEVVRTVYGDIYTPSTILGSLSSARNNARAVRDILPSDFYESINKLYASSGEIDAHSPGQDLRIIIERLAVTHGIYEWLAPLDESAHFFRLGRALERIDLVSRLLAIDMESEWPEQGATTSLRAVGGLSIFLRAKVPVSPSRVRLFLASDPSFPRSLLQSAKEAQFAITQLGLVSNMRVDQELKPVATLGNRLTFLGEDAHEISDVLIQAISAVEKSTELIKDAFFRPIGSIVWSN